MGSGLSAPRLVHRDLCPWTRLGAGALDRFLTEGTQGGFVHLFITLSFLHVTVCLCDDTKENQSQHGGGSGVASLDGGRITCDSVA